MKIKYTLLVLMAFSLAACSTTKSAHSASSHRHDPETVLVDYRVKPGQEAQFEVILRRAWRMPIEKSIWFLPRRMSS